MHIAAAVVGAPVAGFVLINVWLATRRRGRRW